MADVDFIDYAVMGSIALIMTLFSMVLFLSCFKIRDLADRYRLKYGFDKEIEGKHWGNDTEKMEEREKRFKRRVFRD
jgi:hypothetical protein